MSTSTTTNESLTPKARQHSAVIRKELAPPSLRHPELRSLTEIQLDAAIGKWEARFTPRVIDCTCFQGYRGAEGDIECDVKGCNQGEIEIELCVRCDLSEHDCICTAGDFMEVVA